MRAAGRDLSAFAPPAAIPRSKLSRHVFDIRVMTALYGGGVRAGRTDRDHPFRAGSIRGQIRFWWRATAGGRCRDFRQLLEEESRIFGDQTGKSPVEIRVLEATRGVEKNGPNYRDEAIEQGLSAIPYALFPSYEDAKHPGKVYEGGSFRLEIRDKLSPRLHDELYAAIAAWIQFGGIGARTRRGVGALHCKDFSGWWDLSSFLGDGSARPWPTLRGSDVVLGAEDESKQCWNRCLQAMRELRQQRGGFKGRGRSPWPEPDEIRRLRNQYLVAGVKDHRPVNLSRGFPRGAFGLPIVFQFRRDQSGPDPDLDPMRNDLVPEGGDRMASPVILKPFALHDTRARPLLLVLNTPPAPQLLSLRQGALVHTVSRGPRDVIGELIAKAAKDWHVKEGKFL